MCVTKDDAACAFKEWKGRGITVKRVSSARQEGIKRYLSKATTVNNSPMAPGIPAYKNYFLHKGPYHQSKRSAHSRLNDA
jgi:hypothetical protein